MNFKHFKQHIKCLFRHHNIHPLAVDEVNVNGASYTHCQTCHKGLMLFTDDKEGGYNVSELS